MNEQNVRLAVPNRFFRDWVMENHYEVIVESFQTATGQSYQVDFVVTQEKKALETAPLQAAPYRKERPVKKDAQNILSTSLNSKYSFERFVVGASNQFSHAAAMAVAEQAEHTAKSYNPLFIYGGVGLGKTHLLNAIGLKAIDLGPHLNVLYVSGEAFMNELIHCIRFDKMPAFRDKYRNIDCLLMDDIQFIAGKERTQEEFFHTFNTLHDAGKQIVVTSDKFPKEIPNLENRIRNRFEWGLIADIQPPDIETKVAIIEKKASENNIDLPSNVAYYIATNSESNIREMEGFLLRIVAYSSLKRREIDIELVRDVLKSMIRIRSRGDVSIDDIIKVVSAKYGVKGTDIKSPKKNKNIVAARQMCMYLARNFTNSSLSDIGERIGGRDHSTVIYSCKKIGRLMESDGKLKSLAEEIEDKLNNMN